MTTNADENALLLDPPKPRKRRRWKRRLLVVILGTAGSVMLLLQTPAAGWVVRPILAAQTGMNIQSGGIRVSPLGNVTIDHARFLAPGLPGQAGEVLEVRRISARIDWSATLRGSPGLKSVLLDGPELRLSQDVETGLINAGAFEIGSGSGGRVPEVEIINGTVEVGEHRGAIFTALRRWNVRGDVDKADASGVAAFSVAAIPTEPSMGGAPSGSLGVEGTIGPDGLEGRLDGLRLEDWPASIVPTRVRPIYERLDLRGTLLPTRFTVDPDGRTTIAMTLDGVDLNLPFDESYAIEGSGDLLRMRQTRGTVSFGTAGLTCDLSGLIDELAYDVTLAYRGLTTDAPFEAEMRTSFRLDDSFRPRRFLPANTIEKIDMFTGAAADIRAVVSLIRADQGGPIGLSGTADVTNGRARYAKLPYPFADISGTVRFNENAVYFNDIRGSGPTGAGLSVDGSFVGLADDSVVEINIGIVDLPVDDVLLGSLSPGRRGLVEALFSVDRFEELVGDGLVLTPDGRGGADAPEFSFGGMAELALVLRRDPDRPVESRWSKDATVTIDEAGLVPERFPLPIVARGIQIRIADDEISLTGGRYEGLTGGTATVRAELDQTSVRPGRDPLPLIEIEAEGIPVDARLLAAIPGYRDGNKPLADNTASAALGMDDVTLRSILDNLRVSGTVECNALIGPRSDGSIGYDVEANLFGASARPVAWSPSGVELDASAMPTDPLVLDNLDGTVYVTETLIVVDLKGELAAPETPFVPTPVTLLTQLTMPDRRGGLGDVERVGGLLPIQSGPPLPGPELYADARADGLDLAMPVENAVAVVSPALAERLYALRVDRNPDGVVALRALLEGIVGGHTETVLGIDRVDTLSFDHGGVRHRIGPSRGRAELTLGIRPGLKFESFRTPIVSAGSPAGEVAFDGELPILRGDSEGEFRGGSIEASVRGGRIESPLTAQLIGAAAGEGVQTWIEERRVVGGFDLDVTLDAVPGPDRLGVSAGGFRLPDVSVVGRLEPASLALELEDQSVSFDDLGGAITFGGFTGRIDGVSASGDGIAISADGDWGFQPGEGATIDVAMAIYGERFGEAFRAIVPGIVVETLELFEVRASGPVSADNLRITGSGLGTENSLLRAAGLIELSGASATVGVPITEMEGRVAFEADVTSAGSSYAIDLDADRLRAGSLRLEDVSASIVSDPSRPGAVLIPEITGRLHGGRIAGSAQSHVTDKGRQFWVDMHGSDVRAAPVFDDLLLPAGGLQGPPIPGQEQVLSAWSVSDDYTRGLLDMDASLSGLVGDPPSTTGRGVVRVAGGSVIALPGLINLVEFSNLRAPFGATLDLAEAVFYIDGTTLAFERLAASSRTVEILGFGTLDWTTRAMDLRFRSRAVRPFPVLSGVFEKLRDELITTRISGTPGDLRYSAESFGGTRRLVRALLGDSADEQERRIDTVERASRADNNRTQAQESTPVMPTREVEPWGDSIQPDE